MHQRRLFYHVCKNHHMYFTLHCILGLNSCSLCRQCHCKEPVSTCKVLCFADVRLPPEFTVTFSSASVCLQKNANLAEGRKMRRDVKEGGREGDKETQRGEETNLCLCMHCI